MVAYMLLGIALLAILLLLARWFATAEPATLAAVVKWVGGTFLALVVLYLVVSGRIGLLFWLLPVALALFGGVRGLRGLAGAGGAWRTRPSPGQTSSVETEYLQMTLDHDTGAMSGRVRKGAFAGRDLDDLALDELLTLLDECVRADPRSAQVLETYLDRSDHAHWRERMEARRRGGGERGGKAPMTVDEAREILGVGADATPDEVKAAHRRLMQQVHPDHGGSTYLAAQINRAKEILLGA